MAKSILIFLSLVNTYAHYVLQANNWQPELLSLGYSNSFPAPTWLVQTILACISLPQFHKLLIDYDSKALVNDAPLALHTASINDWLFFLNKCNFQPSIGLEKLQLFLSLIQGLENMDGQVLADAKGLIDVLLVKLSSLILGSEDPPSSGSKSLANSLFKGDFLSDSDKMLLGVFTSSILKADDKKMSTKDPSTVPDPFLIIPLLPPRQIEADAILLEHKLWDPNTMNYPAPFSLDSLLLLFNCDAVEFEVCKSFAAKAKHLLAKDLFIDLAFFSLKDADSTKCGNTCVSIRAKAPNPHEYKEEKYLRNVWNLFRPYIKCRCWANKNNNCKAKLCGLTIYYGTLLIMLIISFIYLLIKLVSLHALVGVMHYLMRLNKQF